MKYKSTFSTTTLCVLAASAIALGLVPVAAVAQSAPDYPSRPQQTYGTQLPPHLKALNLSQEQKEKLQAIEAAHQEAMSKNIDQMRSNRIAERELVEAPNFDERKAEKLAALDAKIMEANTLATLRFRHQIYQILTPEQRTQFSEMRAQHQKMRQPKSSQRSTQ